MGANAEIILQGLQLAGTVLDYLRQNQIAVSAFSDVLRRADAAGRAVTWDDIAPLHQARDDASKESQEAIDALKQAGDLGHAD